LKVASLLDLAGTQASVLQVRAEAKDYIDMDTLKALSYFDDGNLRELPEDLKMISSCAPSATADSTFNVFP
jgi:hypothetical protein